MHSGRPIAVDALSKPGAFIENLLVANIGVVEITSDTEQVLGR